MLDTVIEVGKYYDAYVTIEEWKNGNESAEIYAFKDLAQPTDRSGRTIIESATEHWGIAEPPERSLELSDVTKLEDTVRQTFDVPDTQANKHFLVAHYKFNFMVI